MMFLLRHKFYQPTTTTLYLDSRTPAHLSSLTHHIPVEQTQVRSRSPISESASSPLAVQSLRLLNSTDSSSAPRRISAESPKSWKRCAELEVGGNTLQKITKLSRPGNSPRLLISTPRASCLEDVYASKGG